MKREEFFYTREEIKREGISKDMPSYLRCP
jgi:hypothetical protein